MESQNCIFDQINSVITKNQDSTKLNGSHEKPSNGSSYKNFQTGSTGYSNHEESKKLNDDASNQFSKIDSIINRQQLNTKKNSNMFSASQENLKKTECEQNKQENKQTEEKQNNSPNHNNNNNQDKSNQDNNISNSQNLLLQHKISLNKQISNNNGNMNLMNIQPNQFYNSFNLYPNDMNQDFNFTNTQGNNQLQNSYFDLVKINSMKKNDVTLPQLSKFCDSFIQGNINSNINSNNQSNMQNQNQNKIKNNLNYENSNMKNNFGNQYLDQGNNLPHNNANINGSQQMFFNINNSQEYLKKLQSMHNEITMFNQKNTSNQNNPYLNLSGSIKLASSYNGGTISNQQQQNQNGKTQANDKKSQQDNQKDKKDGQENQKEQDKNEDQQQQENKIKNSKINNELTYSQKMEGEELEDMNQQQQLEFNKQYSIMQGLGYPYKQMSFNFYNNNGDPNNNNNGLTNSFNQNYQIQMDQQIFGVHHNNNENENPGNQKQGEQNKKVTENSFPFEYQLQQQKQFYDQLRNSLNGGNAQNSLVLNNSMFQNLDQGIQQNFNNGNQQINSQSNSNFLKNMNNDKYGYSKFKTQGKIATEDGNKNDQNKNNEVFSCIEAVINKQYKQQKNSYKYNKMENIHQKVEENKEQHNLNRQEQLNSADKKKLVKEEEEDSQQNQINFSSSNQKGRITKSSQIYNDVDLNEENIEEKIQKIQEKLKKENELLMENDKETGKRRNQRVWNKDEDFLLKYFHKKYKGKWDLIAKEIPGRNSSQSLQRYRKFNNQKSGRSHWNQDEDRKVLQMIKQFGKNWGLISSNLKNRSGKQVRERYINCLDPSINWKEFTPEEDNKIIEFVKVNGPKWSLISRQLQGRPENMLKNRYYAHLKRLEDDKGTEGRKSKKNQKQMTKEEDKNEVMYQKMIENQNFPQQPLLAYQPNSFLQSNIVDN